LRALASTPYSAAKCVSKPQVMARKEVVVASHLTDQQISDVLRRLRPGAVRFPAGRKWFLTQGHSRFGRHAARGRLDESVGELLLFPPQSLE
jgi:hypothetical protein